MAEHQPIEEMAFFLQFEAIADWVWDEIQTWSEFARSTVGRQLVRSIDSVGANLVEGDGRYSDKDALHFFIMARASAREAKLWIRRAAKRGLVKEAVAEAKIKEITSAARLLNNLIRYRRGNSNLHGIKEELAVYEGLAN